MELQKTMLSLIVASVLATALLAACGGSGAAGSRPAPEATRAPSQPSTALKAPTPSPTAAAALKAPTPSPTAAAALTVPTPSPTVAAALKAPTPSPTAAAALKAPTPSPTAAALKVPTPSPTAAALKAPTPSPIAPAGGTDAEKAQFELGKKIFLVDATDGVACQVCHGPTALGKIGPNIRGKRAGDIKFALETVDAMSFLRLNQKQIEAVAAYLKWLATQPK